MSPEDFERARRAFLENGELDPELLALLRKTVIQLVRFRGLPPIYSPTGHWDRDAEHDVLSDWMTNRLYGTGQLGALLHQADSPRSFIRLGERYLRNHLINQLERSQAGNLFARVKALLDSDAAFERVGEDHWRLSGPSASPFADGDHELLGAAWRLGAFETIHYREDAKKLSPLLDSPELKRFVMGLLSELAAALTAAQIVRALVLRFNLEPPGTVPLEDHEHKLSATVDIAGDIVAGDAARSVLAELSARQAAILRCGLDGMSVREISDELGVSAGTVSGEQQINASVLGRLSDENGSSRGALLNALRDLLFLEDAR